MATVAHPLPRRPEGAQTLERGLLVLRLLADHPHGLTASEVAAELGVHRSVAYRLLMTLVHTGFAGRDQGTRYRVGAELLALGAYVRPGLRSVAEPVLAELADSLGATSCLVVRDGADAVVIAVNAPSTPGTHLSYRVGSRDPLHTGAGGIAVQAATPPIDGIEEPEAVQSARALGYTLSSGEVTPGTHAVAAPIHTDHPDGPAAITVISHRFDCTREAIGPVIAAAERIRCLLAGTAGGGYPLRLS